MFFKFKYAINILNDVTVMVHIIITVGNFTLISLSLTVYQIYVWPGALGQCFIYSILYYTVLYLLTNGTLTCHLIVLIPK